MSVVEKDEVIQGLLQEEHQRCLSALTALEARLPTFPKGALNMREKVHQVRRYTYYYLVYREGGRVVNKHVPSAQLPALRKQLEERDRCRKEVRAYKRRVTYLEKLLGYQRKGSQRVAHTRRVAFSG